MVAAFKGGQGAKAGSIGYREEVTPTLTSTNSGTNAVPDVVFGLDCRNLTGNEGVSGTLQSNGRSLNHQNPIVFTNCLNPWDQQSSRQYTIDGVYETLKAHQGGRCEGIVYPIVTGALCANSHPGSYTGQDAFNDMLPVVPADKPNRKYIVRRLTPLECCRLQGFPDWWEHGVEGSDSARYKMWGNGIALPCAQDVLRRITKCLKTE